MPSNQDIRVSQSLTNYSVGYKNGSYIAETVLPRVSEKRVNPFAYTWSRDNYLLQNDLRAPGTESAEVTFGLSKGTPFILKEHALKSRIPKEDMEAAANADSQWDLKRDHVSLLNDALMLRHEYDVASLLFNTATFSGYTSALSGNSRWDQFGTSDPISDVYNALENVRQQTGIIPNTIVIGIAVFRKLQNHPDILDRIKYQGSKATPAEVTAQALAAIFQVNQVIVGSAVFNGAAQGLQGTAAFASNDVWGKFVLVAYVNPTPSPLSPSLGYNYYNPDYEAVKEWYEEKPESWFVEVKKKFLPLVNSAISGYLYSTVIS